MWSIQVWILRFALQYYNFFSGQQIILRSEALQLLQLFWCDSYNLLFFYLARRWILTGRVPLW